VKLAIIAAMAILAFGCGQSDAPQSSLPTIPVRLPNGKVIRAELATTPAEQQRGLMYRTELPPGRGMLFVFQDTSNRPFWMYHTLIPLDIIWLDANRRIVFISAETPPCRSEDPADCPNYGDGYPARFVLELAGGRAAANGLKVGDMLQF
jgi:hypothetical protein